MFVNATVLPYLLRNIHTQACMHWRTVMACRDALEMYDYVSAGCLDAPETIPSGECVQVDLFYTVGGMMHGSAQGCVLRGF